MTRAVCVSKRDVCPGDIPQEVEYELDDRMTIPDLLEFIAHKFLWSYLHYHWRIVGNSCDRPLGFINRRKPDERLALNGPADVVAYLNQQLNNDDLVECCVPLEQTLKDLDVTAVYCVDE